MVKKFFMTILHEMYAIKQDPITHLAGFCFYFGLGFGGVHLLHWLGLF